MTQERLKQGIAEASGQSLFSDAVHDPRLYFWTKELKRKWKLDLTWTDARSYLAFW